MYKQKKEGWIDVGVFICMESIDSFILAVILLVFLP